MRGLVAGQAGEGKAGGGIAGARGAGEGEDRGVEVSGGGDDQRETGERKVGAAQGQGLDGTRASPGAGGSTRKFRPLFWEFVKFELGLGLTLLAAAGVFYVANGYSLSNYRFWFEAFWYPIAFCYMLAWVVVVRKVNFRSILANKPKWPKKGERWFYVAFSVAWVAIVVAWLVLLWIGLAVVTGDRLVILVGFWHACVGAPVVEEILFRGYWYERGREVYGEDRWLVRWDREERDPVTGLVERKRVMTFQVTYAGLASSLFFGLWHINPLQAAYTLFIGLFFAKTRREWGESLVPPMLLHSAGNFLARIASITTFLFLDDLVNLVLGFI
ncbi:MAG: CPBP family glutamic-type intramembrane protease [Promethearchaeota archaeon]